MIFFYITWIYNKDEIVKKLYIYIYIYVYICIYIYSLRDIFYFVLKCAEVKYM